MKESGIVRKLDNLGRLVIPKEIRRCMRIKEGSPIEFGLLPSGEIVLCKYSLISQISDYADDFCEVIGDTLDCVSIITDRDKIIASYGISKKNTIGAKLSSEILDIIDGNSCYTASEQSGTTLLPIIDGENNTYKVQMIYPISIQGDVEGVIILLDNKGDRTFGNEHITTLKMVAKFISMQME
jgi:AbrB family transcriptional regulator (stage V sporulation protein T)